MLYVNYTSQIKDECHSTKMAHFNTDLVTTDSASEYPTLVPHFVTR